MHTSDGLFLVEQMVAHGIAQQRRFAGHVHLFHQPHLLGTDRLDAYAQRGSIRGKRLAQHNSPRVGGTSLASVRDYPPATAYESDCTSSNA